MEMFSICLPGKRFTFHIYTSSLPTKFLRASSFPDLHNSLIYCFSLTEKLYYNEEVMQWAYYRSIHWFYMCTNSRCGQIDRMMEWLIEICYLLYKEQYWELKYCPIHGRKFFKSATNMRHYCPKARMHGYENQAMDVRMAHHTGEIIFFFISTLDSVYLEYLFLKREILPPGNAIMLPLNWNWQHI